MAIPDQQNLALEEEQLLFELYDESPLFISHDLFSASALGTTPI